MNMMVVRRGELSKFGLGKETPPELGLPENIELIWNMDEGQWEVYRQTHKGAVPAGDELKWQISIPFKGLPITQSIKQWLQKYDTTENGGVSHRECKRRWIQHVDDVMIRDDRRRENILQDAFYEVGHRSRWLGQYQSRGGAARKSIVAPITVGYNKKTNKPIRMYKK